MATIIVVGKVSGLWCKRCNRNSVIEFDLSVDSDTKVDPAGTYAACIECGPPGSWDGA